MTQFTNLDIEKKLQYILTSNEMLDIHNNDQENTLMTIVLRNIYWRWAMTSYSVSIVENYTDFILCDTMITK